MSFDNREIDDKKLLEEIDNLDSEYNKEETEKENKEVKSDVKKNERNKNIFIVVLLILVLFAYCGYEKFIKKNETLIDTDEIKEKIYDLNYFKNGDSMYDQDDDIVYDDEDNSIIEEFDEEEYENMISQQKIDFKNSKEKIEVTVEKETSYDEILTLLENKSDKAVFDFNVAIIFYDHNGKVVDVEKNPIDYIEANDKIWYSFNKSEEEYEKYDFIITKDYYSYPSQNLKDSVKYDVTEKDEQVYITGKNNSSEDIDSIEFVIEYYDKENNLVDIEYVYEYDIKANEEFELESFGQQEDMNMDMKDVTYKVVLNYAIGIN